MKKTLLIIFLLIVNINFAQLAVTDPTLTKAVEIGNTSSKTFFGKSISQAVAQVNHLIELKKKYEEQMKLVKEVNGYISSGKQILRIKSSVRDITVEYANAINFIKTEPLIDYESKGALIHGYSMKLDESLVLFEDAITALSSNFNMNDAERLAILEKVDGKLKHQKEFLIYFRNKISYNVQKKKETKYKNDFINNEVKSINKIN